MFTYAKKTKIRQKSGISSFFDNLLETSFEETGNRRSNMKRCGSKQHL